MESYELLALGKATEREMKLIDHLFNCIGNYLEDNLIDRIEITSALFHICTFNFIKRTNYNLDGQIDEIDQFCQYLKKKAEEYDNEN